MIFFDLFISARVVVVVVLNNFNKKKVDGSLRVNPGESAVISEESVIFAMCAQQSDLDPLALNGSAAVSVWLKQFGDNRSAGYSKRKTEALKLDQVRREKCTQD
jgi:hypothetical protein